MKPGTRISATEATCLWWHRHESHRWAYTSEGGGHMAELGRSDDFEDYAEWDCPGRTEEYIPPKPTPNRAAPTQVNVDYCIRSDGGHLGSASSAMAGWWDDLEIAQEEADRRNEDDILLEFFGTWRVYERTTTVTEKRIDDGR